MMQPPSPRYGVLREGSGLGVRGIRVRRWAAQNPVEKGLSGGAAQREGRHGQQADRGEAHCSGMVDGESGGGGGDAPEGGVQARLGRGKSAAHGDHLDVLIRRMRPRSSATTRTMRVRLFPPGSAALPL